MAVEFFLMGAGGRREAPARRWTLWDPRDSLLLEEEFEEGHAPRFQKTQGWRMTGSAYQAMDVFDSSENLLIGVEFGERKAVGFLNSV